MDNDINDDEQLPHQHPSIFGFGLNRLGGGRGGKTSNPNAILWGDAPADELLFGDSSTDVILWG